MKRYTRIKHEVFENIFARGLLNVRELQVISVIIRESWGWDKGKSNWTKRPLSNKYFVKKTGISKSHICELLQQMILEKKILKKDGYYSFNEHFDQWEKFPKRELLKSKKVPKKGTQSSQKGNWKFLKGELLVPKKGTFDGLEIDVTTISMKDLRALLKLPKESIKEIFKEIFKESTDSLRLFYEEKIGRKLRTFGRDREKKLKDRMENFSLNELKKVIENISKSDWHMGRDPKSNGRAYNDFELLFRSDAKVEQYLNLKSNEPFAGEKQWLLRRRLASGKV